MPPKASGTLGDIEKGRILALYEDGQKISQIANTFGRPWTIVRDFGGTMSGTPTRILKNLGRPSKLSERDKTQLNERPGLIAASHCANYAMKSLPMSRLVQPSVHCEKTTSGSAEQPNNRS
jgi:hypothetical protein